MDVISGQKSAGSNNQQQPFGFQLLINAMIGGAKDWWAKRCEAGLLWRMEKHKKKW